MMLPEEFLKRISGQSYLDSAALLQMRWVARLEVSVRVNPSQMASSLLRGYEKSRLGA
ncbi:MAG: hypothetical protein MZV63_68295 [Marinilabiliales bacterium]|nr:hypothetical protein [Marinilabiliales bacterium]